MKLIKVIIVGILIFLTNCNTIHKGEHYKIISEGKEYMISGNGWFSENGCLHINNMSFCGTYVVEEVEIKNAR